MIIKILFQSAAQAQLFDDLVLDPELLFTEAIQIAQSLAPTWQLPTIEQYAEIFPNPDPSRDNDPQLSIIDEANEDFGLQLYRTHMRNLAAFNTEFLNDRNFIRKATDDDFTWTLLARTIAWRQADIYLHVAYHIGSLTHNQ